jgi:putative addiction module CopG family antidote
MARPAPLAHLPEYLARFAEAEVAAGHFASVDDVLTAGVEALAEKQRRQQRHDTNISAINAALEEGETSGLAEDGVFERVRARLGLPRRPAERKSLAQLFAESPLKGLDLNVERNSGAITGEIVA